MLDVVTPARKVDVVPRDPEAFPEPVVALFKLVDTVEKLEVLRCLHADRDRAHAPAGLADRIGASADAIAEALGDLEAAGLLSIDGGGGYWYAPSRHELDDAIGALVGLYEDDRLGVLRAITVAALDRIRSSAARTFSEAFVIRRRKEPDDG